MRFKRYKKTKDSGIMWIGKVPKHWGVFRLKHLADIQTGITPSKNDPENYSENGIPWVKPDNLGTFFPVNKTKEYLTSKGTKVSRIIPKNAILMCCIASIGKMGVAGCDLTTNQQINSLIFNEKTDINFSKYMVFASGEEHCRLANGNVVPILNAGTQGNIAFAVPSRQEQLAIASFLDRETSRIDALIAKKEHQIELLQEKRSAIISHAVTKGLNPDAKMKDSGIEWLGEIPEHWETKRIKYIGKIKYGLGEPPEQLESGIPFIRATDIYRGNINAEKILTVNPEKVPWSRKPELRIDDILVVRSGAYTGDSAIVPKEWEGSIAGYDMVLQVTKASPHFVAYALLSRYLLESQIYLERMRAAQPHLNAEELGSFLILIPPMEEQYEINDFLNTGIEKLDKMVDKVLKSIELLHEYRTALIAATITGKIEVWKEAA